MENSDFGYLRLATDLDQLRILAWRNDPNIRSMMYTQHEISLDEHNDWWQRVKISKDHLSFMYISNGIETGFVSFSQISRLSGTAFWAFYAQPNAPRGTGSKMEFLALEQAFSVENLRKLNCEVLEKNYKVIQLHKTFGFQQEGIFSSHILVDEDFQDVHRLAIFKSTWEKIKIEKHSELLKRNSK